MLPKMSALGVGSGLKLDELVTKLVTAESGPRLEKIDKQEVKNYEKITALSNIRTALFKFQDSISEIKNSKTFDQRQVVVSDETFLSVVAAPDAGVSECQIKIQQLARASRYATSNSFVDDSEVLGPGIISFTMNGAVSKVTVPDGQDSLGEVRDCINLQTKQTGVSATILTLSPGVKKLLLNGVKTGAVNNFTVSVTDLLGAPLVANTGLSQLVTAHLTPIETAQNAEILMDNFPDVIQRDSNVISDVLDDVTLTLKKSDVNTALTVQIQENKEPAKAAIQRFVEGYNQWLEACNKVTQFKEKIEDDADSTKKTNENDEHKNSVGKKDKFRRGVLFGDPFVRTLMNSLRGTLSASINNVGSAYTSFMRLGMKTSEETGLIDWNSPETQQYITKALDNDFKGVKNLFVGDNRFAQTVETQVTRFLNRQGGIPMVVENLSTQNQALERQRTQVEKRLERYEIELRKRFGNLDGLITQLQGRGDALQKALSSLPKLNAD